MVLFVFQFPQFVILEDLSILDYALSGVKGLSLNTNSPFFFLCISYGNSRENLNRENPS